MNPGEIWRLDDGSNRVVLSPATYNASGKVVTAAIGGPPKGFDPFAVTTEHGTVYADRIAMHPREWMTAPAARIAATAYAEVQRHLSFLLNLDPP